MIELLLAYQRPSSLAEPEFRSWLAASTKALTRASASSTVEPSRIGARNVLHLTINADPRCRCTHDAIADLLGDMHMLGLRPEVIAASDDGSIALAAVLPGWPSPSKPNVTDTRMGGKDDGGTVRLGYHAR